MFDYKFRYFFFGIYLFAILGIAGVSGLFISSERTDVEDGLSPSSQERLQYYQDTGVLGAEYNQDSPYIANSPAEIVDLGQEFSFMPIVGFDSPVKVKLVSSPTWMYYDQERVFGVPQSEDLGFNRYTVRVTTETGESYDFQFNVEVR